MLVFCIMWFLTDLGLQALTLRVNVFFSEPLHLPWRRILFTCAVFLVTASADPSQILVEPAPKLENAETVTDIDLIIGEWTDPSQIQGSPAESVEYYGFDNAADDELELLDVAGQAVDEGILGGADPQKAGMWRNFGLSIRTGVQYSTNARGGGTTEDSGDTIFSISPTVSYGRGVNDSRASVSAAYTPSALFYLDNSNLNRLNHRFSLNAGYQLPKTTIGISADYSLSDAGDSYLAGGSADDQADDAERFLEDGTTSTTYGLGINLSHRLTGKSNLGLGLTYSDNLFDGSGIDRSTFNSNLSWQYQMTGKISAGPYVSGERSAVEGGGDQTAYGIGTAIDYQVGAKTTIGGLIGVENRSFSGEGAVGEKAFLTYELNGGYAVTSKINLTGSLYRSVRPSYTEFDEATTSTGVNFGAAYQILERVSTSASIAYAMDDFISTQENVGASRGAQDYLSVSLGASWSVGDQWVLGADFSWRQNSSDNSFQNFDTVVTGVSASFEF